MNVLDYWRLCDEFTVIQAALLIAGEDPAQSQEWVDGWNPDQRPEGYDAARAALSNAVISGRLPATIRYKKHQTLDETNLSVVELNSNEPDWMKTTILIDDIRAWLRNHGRRTGFFFQNIVDELAFLDPKHKRYAPKMAATHNAWLKAGDEAALNGKSPKQALIKVLREDAEKYLLIDANGKLNETGIEECAKIANWNEKGGAPKTPGT